MVNRRATWAALGTLAVLVVTAAPAAADVTGSLTRTTGTGLTLDVNATQGFNYVAFTLPAGYAVATVTGPPRSECLSGTGSSSFGCVFQDDLTTTKIILTTSPCLPSGTPPSTLKVGETHNGYQDTSQVAAPSSGPCTGGSGGGGGGSGGGGSGSGGGSGAGADRIVSVKVTSGPAVTVKLDAPQGATAIDAMLTAKSHGHTTNLASTVLTSVSPGRSTLRLTLNRSGRTLLKRAHRLTATLRVVFVTANGQSTVATKHIALGSARRSTRHAHKR